MRAERSTSLIRRTPALLQAASSAVRPKASRQRPCQPLRRQGLGLAPSGRRPGRCPRTFRQRPCRAGREARSGGRTARRLAWRRASLRPWVSSDTVVDERLETTLEIATAELMSDEQRLTRCVGRRVGKLCFENDQRSLEVGRDQPFTMSSVESRAQLERTASADLEERLWDRSAKALVWMRISSSIRGHASCAVARRAVLRARDDAGGNVAANRPKNDAGSGPPKMANPRAAPTTNSAAMTPRNSPTRTSASPACTNQSRPNRRPRRRVLDGRRLIPRQPRTIRCT